MANVRRIFPGGNTAEGFYSFHDNIIGPNRNMLYILKGMPGGGKSSMMSEIGDKVLRRGYSLEYHHCPSDPRSIDGINIPDLGIAMVDGTSPHIVDPVYPGLKDRIIDLGRFIDRDILMDKKEEIIGAKGANKAAYRKAFSYFKAGKSIYEEIKAGNRSLIDVKEVNKLGLDLIDRVFSKEEKPLDYNGFNERYLFSSAYTPEGYVDYTDTILEGVGDVYYMNGEIGVGKSRILNIIFQRSRILNYSVEIYYDPMFPRKIESLFIKDLDTIITSNKSGKSFAKEIFDFNEYMKMNKINKEDYKSYNLLISRGLESLSKAKDNHFILEKAYNPAIDYGGINIIRRKLLKDILG